jgi:hypothetical protein
MISRSGSPPLSPSNGQVSGKHGVGFVSAVVALMIMFVI